MEQSPSPTLEDCLKLLKGERDEQRLAGLLLVTKFCNGDDHDSIRQVYNAVGVHFLNRLLRTGIGEGRVNASRDDNREAYLQLSITVLASFCRVPDIASSEDMVLKIPQILDIISKESGSSFIEECYEFLVLVLTACENGITTMYKSEGLKVLASHIITLPDGSRMMELAIKLVQLIISKMPLGIINDEYSSELSMIVTKLAKQLAILHNAMKFETLHLLCAILSSEYSVRVHEKLRIIADDMWSTYIRTGIMAILQNRVAPAEKLQALILSESIMSILGEGWLIGQVNFSDMGDPIPVDRCILLVLESSRVEIAVMLNELGYMKYEASKNSSPNNSEILLRQRNLAIAFSLVERIIKVISILAGDEDTGSIISEGTFIKVISGLNETIGVVLEYLQDAKDHGQKKGDDLLACVRIIGSYLAETPLACKDKIRELLGYILSVEGEDEPSPFYAVCFLLPMLCQITMEVDGCKALAYSGAYNAVVECLIKLIGPNGSMAEDNGTIFLACDTILNFLLKREQIQFALDCSSFVSLLRALVYWTDKTNEPSVLMMAASICSLIFDLTSEEALLQHSDFDRTNLESLSRVILKSMVVCEQDLMPDDAKSDMDLQQIVNSEYFRWADRFPFIKEAVGEIVNRQ